MSTFLLELLSEEVPARMQEGARIQIRDLFIEKLQAHGVTAEEITVFSTPRRLALLAYGLPTTAPSIGEEIKGPPESAKKEAIDGFCRKYGLSKAQLEVREHKGRPTIFGVLKTPETSLVEVLSRTIPEIVSGFSWPKSMRWGKDSISTNSMRWVRPLKGIVALFDKSLVECRVGNIVSTQTTYGHRFLSPGPIEIFDPDSYVKKLKRAFVVVDHNEREKMIMSGARTAAEKEGLNLRDDQGLAKENAGLTEWPITLLGTFEEDFLQVPPEVISLTAALNQKYFVCEKNPGELANHFVFTANIAPKNISSTKEGNVKVLTARLADAKFFWETDKKRPLSQQLEKLARITFHDKLGTLFDKSQRVAKLARELCEKGVINADPDLAEKAGMLCKADLVSEMVGEFPELQGIMGGYYAAEEGLPDEVSRAIRDHYKPVGFGDVVPTSGVTIAVAIADKLDTLENFFRIDERPTGSKDPFALRRAAIGVIRLIQENRLRFEVANGELLAFFIDRLKVQQRGAGVRHDLIDAVFSVEETGDLVRVLDKVKALQSFIQTEDGQDLLIAYRRAVNILKDKKLETIHGKYEKEPAETRLNIALEKAELKASEAVGEEDFTKSMSALAQLRVPIDDYFSTVTVNSDDPVKRAFRLQMLDRFKRAVHKVADFGRIDG